MSLPALKRSLALLALIVTTTAWAAPHYADLRMSDSADGDETDTFTPQTAKIFVHASLEDVPTGSKLSSVWIAEDSGGAAPPNYKIDSVELTVGAMVNVATFSLSKPNAGWPVGTYRVDLSIDGKPAGTMHFKVAAAQ